MSYSTQAAKADMHDAAMEAARSKNHVWLEDLAQAMAEVNEETALSWHIRAQAIKRAKTRLLNASDDRPTASDLAFERHFNALNYGNDNDE